MHVDEFLADQIAPHTAQLWGDVFDANDAQLLFGFAFTRGQLIRSTRFGCAPQYGMPAVKLALRALPGVTRTHVDDVPFNAGADELFIVVPSRMFDVDAPPNEPARDTFFVLHLGSPDRSEMCIVDADTFEHLHDGQLHRDLAATFLPSPGGPS